MLQNVLGGGGGGGGSIPFVKMAFWYYYCYSLYFQEFCCLTSLRGWRKFESVVEPLYTKAFGTIKVASRPNFLLLKLKLLGHWNRLVWKHKFIELFRQYWMMCNHTRNFNHFFVWHHISSLSDRCKALLVASSLRVFDFSSLSPLYSVLLFASCFVLVCLWQICPTLFRLYFFPEVMSVLHDCLGNTFGLNMKVWRYVIWRSLEI